MAKMKKIITAGALVKEVIYPIGNRHDDHQTRAGKKNLSSEAQRRMNDIYSWQKLEMMLAANFIPGDLIVVLTYDDQHLPRSRKEAAEKLKYFRAKLSAARRNRKQELVMFWNEEHKHEHADWTQDGRWHHHCVINATQGDYKEILQLWGQGLVYIRPLRVDGEKNYESLARYMCKEARDKLGQRSWSYTRNARKPEVESFRVADDTQLTPPEGSTIIAEASSRTEYGNYYYIKYLGTSWERIPRKRTPRRRKC